MDHIDCLRSKCELEHTRFWYKVNSGSYPQNLPVNIGWSGATSEVATNPAKIKLYCESSGFTQSYSSGSFSYYFGSGDVVFTLL